MSDLWDDISDTPTEAAVMRVRSALMDWVGERIRRADLAAVLGFTARRTEELMEHRIARFTVEDLIDVVTKLDGRVSVSVEGGSL